MGDTGVLRRGKELVESLLQPPGKSPQPNPGGFEIDEPGFNLPGDFESIAPA